MGTGRCDGPPRCDQGRSTFSSERLRLRSGRDGVTALGMTVLVYIGAALAEIGGCFAFWAWLRMGRSVWWLGPGVASLCLFAWLLTLVEADHAGRAYAAYGAIYIMAAVLWLWAMEGVRPDRWDMIGMAICLIGGAVILWGPRSA